MLRYERYIYIASEHTIDRGGTKATKDPMRAVPSAPLLFYLLSVVVWFWGHTSLLY